MSLAVPILFGIIVVVGLLGNLLVVIVVTANQQMRSTTNLLIINLALADLLFIVLCVPFTAVDYMLPYWPFGDLWCKMVQYLIVVTVYASVYTLVLMSLDRFVCAGAHTHTLRSNPWPLDTRPSSAMYNVGLFVKFQYTPEPIRENLNRFRWISTVIYSSSTFQQPPFTSFFPRSVLWSPCLGSVDCSRCNGLFTNHTLVHISGCQLKSFV